MEQYEVLEKIGNGAFGEVFRAKHVSTGEVVAIKKLRVNDDGRLRVLPAVLFQEIEALRQLEHANVVTLLDTFADGTNVALVLEYVETDLFTVIRRRQADFSDAEIRGIMQQLLLAVAYCHRHRIIHRDIKPGNLLVTATGELKLTDFGLATVYVGREKMYSHQVATRWYRAPELLFGSREYDTAIDLWAVGAILAELLHLVPLFPGQNDIDQLYRIIQILGSPEKTWPEVRNLPDYCKVEFPPYEPVSWRDVFPDASPEAVDLLSKLLVLNPSKRLSAAEALHHPFFFAGDIETRIPVPPSLLSSMKRDQYSTNRGHEEDEFLNSLGKPLIVRHA